MKLVLNQLFIAVPSCSGGCQCHACISQSGNSREASGVMGAFEEHSTMVRELMDLEVSCRSGLGV